MPTGEVLTPAPPTPEQVAVEVDRLPAAVVDDGVVPPAPTADQVAVETDRIPAALVEAAPGGEEFDRLASLSGGHSISGSVDVVELDTASAGFGDVFLDPAIPAAGVGVFDETGGGDIVGDLAKEIVEAAGDALAAVARLWADPPSPGLGTVGADGAAVPSEATDLLTGSLAWYSGAVAVVAVLVAAARMVWQRRTQPLAELLRGLGTLVLVAGASLTGVTLLVTAADAFSVWVLQQATGDVQAGLTDLLALQQTDGMSAVLVVLLGTAALLGAVVQIVLLVARGVVLVVLAGVLPLSASATNTDTGRVVFVRTLTWTLAFALYQPAAALVYATGLLLAPAPEDAPLVAALTGTTFLALAIAALPALLRVLQPAVRTVTAGGNRVRAAAGGLPSGARAVAPGNLGAGGATAASAVRVPSARGAGHRTAAATIDSSGARVGARLEPGRHRREAVPAVSSAPEAVRAAAEPRSLPTARTDAEDPRP
ncbi:hypothetical protein ACI79E_11965 [Geodermatophilus sp. SYSU D00079]